MPCYNPAITLLQPCWCNIMNRFKDLRLTARGLTFVPWSTRCCWILWVPWKSLGRAKVITPAITTQVPRCVWLQLLFLLCILLESCRHAPRVEKHLDSCDQCLDLVHAGNGDLERLDSSGDKIFHFSKVDIWWWPCNCISGILHRTVNCYLDCHKEWTWTASWNAVRSQHWKRHEGMDENRLSSNHLLMD